MCDIPDIGDAFDDENLDVVSMAPTTAPPTAAPTSAETTYDCVLPSGTTGFSLITEGDAEFSAHNVYQGLAIGGSFTQMQTSSSMVVDGESFIWEIQNVNNLNINWNGGLDYPARLDDVFDFEHFKWLARNAEDYTDRAGKNVFVVTHGGSFSTYDFNGDSGQGEDNGNTLVIFNTDEDVTLTKTQHGRQFGPSVLAPFANVYLEDSAGYVDGFVVAVRVGSDGRSKCDRSSSCHWIGGDDADCAWEATTTDEPGCCFVNPTAAYTKKWQDSCTKFYAERDCLQLADSDGALRCHWESIGEDCDCSQLWPSIPGCCRGSSYKAQAKCAGIADQVGCERKDCEWLETDDECNDQCNAKSDDQCERSSSFHWIWGQEADCSWEATTTSAPGCCTLTATEAAGCCAGTSKMTADKCSQKDAQKDCDRMSKCVWNDGEDADCSWPTTTEEPWPGARPMSKQSKKQRSNSLHAEQVLFGAGADSEGMGSLVSEQMQATVSLSNLLLLIVVAFALRRLYRYMAPTITTAISILFFVSVADPDFSEPQIVTNTFDTCLSQYGKVACWGRNHFGQLGRGSTDDLGDDFILCPIDLGDDFVVKQIAGGSEDHHCAVSVDHILKCWGNNDRGIGALHVHEGDARIMRVCL